jgi:PAS domain S-box-containing protein
VASEQEGDSTATPPGGGVDDAELTRAESKFRLLAENIGDVFWFLELDPLHLTYVSPAFERIWGHAVEEVLADHEVWEKAIHPDDHPAVYRAFYNWIEGVAAHYQVEYRIVGRDGRIRWIADRGIVLHHREGRAHQMCGIASDITERKHAETVLAEKAGEMRAIIEGTADGILIADVETRRFTFGNSAICRMLGVTPAELLTMGMEMIHPEGLLPEIREQFDAMGRSELSVVRDVPLLRRDGSIRHVDIAGSVVVINGHRCNLGVFHDVSALRRAEAKFSALLEAAPDAMMIHDSSGRIQIINAQAEKLFGYGREELIGRTMELLMPERYRRDHVRHRTSYTPQSPPRAMGTGLTLFALHKDGREIPVEISLSNLGADGGPMVISSIRDISGRVAAEEALRQSQRLAQSTFEAIPAGLAVLDEHGVILSTNDAWKDLAEACPGSAVVCGPGESYLEACLAATDEDAEPAGRLAAGIRDVLSGVSPRFVMEFPLHASQGTRWFVGHVMPFRGSGPRRVVVAHLDITLRKRAERVVRRLNEELEHRVEERTLELRRAHETIQSEMAARLRLEQEILEISERERQRIGQDLHDDLGQQLAGAWCLSMALENELKGLRSVAAPSAARITQTLQNALALTRSLARGLHPVAVEAGGLGAALKDLAVRTGEIFHVNCTCQVPNPVPCIDHHTATHLYRIAQESVTNAVKHGKASLIAITLEVGAKEAVLTISDNGVGLAHEPSSGEGMGLRIMPYRAHMIGGRLDISAGRNGGTVVSCAFPASPTLPSAENP